ncbi:MAG: flagellar assembly protein FliW [Phycisphaerae bacterium]|nr:flagellar assembly protein FliW [Phycisphaerae bacterium]
MLVETTRFGAVEIDDSRIIQFPAGLLGFSSYRRYALLQPDEQGIFFWLQSIDAPDLAFVVTDPALWIPDYQAQIRREQMDELGLGELADAQVLVIVNKRDGALTANLQGPLVINAKNCSAMQLVLAEKRWTTRHVLMNVSERAKATA